MTAYYPLFADLHGRRCVVAGGGAIAQRKVTTLLQYGAEVTVVSPTLTARLSRLARDRRVRHVARRFRAGDVRGAWLVYAATNDETVNDAVFRAAARQRIFANVVDQPARCSFIAPAILRRGPLVIAVSTGGASPTVAKRLRDELDSLVGDEYAALVRLFGRLRDPARRQLPTYRDRKRYFERLVSGRVRQLVRRGRVSAAHREALAELNGGR